MLPILLIACSTTPAPAPPVEPEPAPVVAPEPEPEPTPVVRPSQPALHSFTGQATEQGAGLWNAFYPLGWSDSGQFAWVDERRVNDMALEYGATWKVLDTKRSQSWTVTHAVENPSLTLDQAWTAVDAEVQTLLAEHGIEGPAPAVVPLPTAGVTAEWVHGPVTEGRRVSHLWVVEGAQRRQVWEGRVTDLIEPAAPHWIESPDRAHAVIVVPVVQNEPVEALVNVDYIVVPFRSRR